VVPLKTEAAGFSTRVKALGGSRYEVQIEQRTVALELVSVSAPDVRFLVDGVVERAGFAQANETIWLTHGGLTLMYADTTFAPPAKGAAGSDGRLTAPIDGKIIAVHVVCGAVIAQGQTLAVLEAMKMQFVISSAVDGVVEDVACQVGQQVKARQLLIGLAPASV
jgi:geranyl-CoA carboxylase alpha subunit